MRWYCGHFAVHAFAPIVIASVAGTVINRLEFGDVTEFSLIEGGALQFYVELPAFLILGLVSGLIAVAFMRATFWAEDMGNLVQRLTGIPRWLRPAIAGAPAGRHRDLVSAYHRRGLRDHEWPR